MFGLYLVKEQTKNKNKCDLVRRSVLHVELNVDARKCACGSEERAYVCPLFDRFLLNTSEECENGMNRTKSRKKRGQQQQQQQKYKISAK